MQAHILIVEDDPQLGAATGHLTTLRKGLASGAPVDRSALASAIDEAHYIGALLHNLGAGAKLDAAEIEGDCS